MLLQLVRCLLFCSVCIFCMLCCSPQRLCLGDGEITSIAHLAEPVVDSTVSTDSTDFDTDSEEAITARKEHLQTSSETKKRRRQAILGTVENASRTRRLLQSQNTEPDNLRDYEDHTDYIDTAKIDEYEPSKLKRMVSITASRIHEHLKNALESNYGGSHHTILCAILRTKHGRYKKFCFCSHSVTAHPKSEEEIIEKIATKLGYDYIKTPPGHAEACFLQYILRRAQEHKTVGYYTHVAALGCSRPICRDCDKWLSLVLDQHDVSKPRVDGAQDYSKNLSVFDATIQMSCGTLLARANKALDVNMTAMCQQGRQANSSANSTEQFLKDAKNTDYAVSRLR